MASVIPAPKVVEPPESVTQTTKQGKPPKNRITHPQQARAIYRKQKEDNFNLARQRARIKNQLDGNAPFDSAARKKRGLDWLSNVNFRDNWSTCRKSINGAWNMFTNVFSFFDWSTIETDPQAPHMDYGKIIGEEMTKILLDDPRFHYNFRLRLKQMYYYGSGAMFWPDKNDWRSRAVLNANILVPYNAKSCTGELDFIIVRDELELGEIFDSIDDEEAAREAGWNVAEVRKLIVKFYHKGEVATDNEVFMSSEWESIQYQIKNKTDQTDNQFAQIRVNHFLVQETDDMKVTHIIMAQNDDQIGFLYYGDRDFESMDEAIHIMFYDEGEGYYRSARGLAYELFPTSNINDRVTNALLDGAMLSSGLIVQGINTQDSEDLATIVKQGPILQLPAGLQMIQNRSFTPPLQPLVEIRRMVQGIQQNNSGTEPTFQDENFQRGLPDKSATQASIESTNSARFESATAAWSYVQWEPWLKETGRRFLNPSYPSDAPGYNEHRLLMERCRKRGVPPQWMKYDVWDRKTAERAIGLGNPVEARRLTQSLVAMGSQLTEDGRKAAMYDWVGVRFGYHRVNRYLPEVDPLTQMTNDVAIVQLENNDLAQGQQMQPAKDQPQTVHITWHMRWLSDFIKPYLQPQPQMQGLEQMFAGTMAAIQHLQGHIMFLSQDPLRKNQAKEWLKPLQDFFRIAQQMQNDIAQMQKLKAATAEEANRRGQEAEKLKQEKDQSAAMEKVRSKERIDMANVISLDNARDQKTRSAIQNQDEKVDADISREDKKADAEIARKDRTQES